MTTVATAADLVSVPPPVTASGEQPADPVAASTGSGPGFTDALDAAAQGAAPPAGPHGQVSGAPRHAGGGDDGPPAAPVPSGRRDRPGPAGADGGAQRHAGSPGRQHTDIVGATHAKTGATDPSPTTGTPDAASASASATTSPAADAIVPAVVVAAQSPGDGSGAGSITAPAVTRLSDLQIDATPVLHGPDTKGEAPLEADAAAEEGDPAAGALATATSSGDDEGRAVTGLAPNAAVPAAGPAAGSTPVRPLLSTARQSEGTESGAPSGAGRAASAQGPDNPATAGGAALITKPHDVASGTSISSAPGPVASASAPAPAPASAQIAAAETPGDVADVNLPDQVVSILAPLQSGPDGTHLVTLGLTPEGLGSVQATVMVGPQQVVVNLWADSQTGHAALAQTLSQLNSQLSDESNRRVTVTLADFGSAQPDTSGGAGGHTDRENGRRTGQSPAIGTIEYSPATVLPLMGGGAQMVDLRL
jgi:hypothetical protein